MNIPSSGLPRPLSKTLNDSIKVDGAAKSGYRGREMDEKARKEREDRQRKLVLQRRQLELKEMDLRTQEDKYNSLCREIARLENQTQKSTTITSETILSVENLERRNQVKIMENENKIKNFEHEIARLKKEDLELDQKVEAKKREEERARRDLRGVESQVRAHQKIIQEKTQETILAVNRMKGIRQEIKMIQDRIQELQK